MEEDQEELLARLRTEHGKIAAFEVPDFGLVVFKGTRNRAQYGKYFNALVNEKSDKYNESVALALACVVHPSVQQLREWLRDNPGDAPEFAAAAAELCSSGARKLEGN